MKKLFNKKTCGTILLIAFALLILFQLLIVFGLVPYNIVWAGQLTQDNYMTVSIISIIIIILFIIIVAIKMDLIKAGKASIVGTIGVWIIFVYFVFNTLGNIASAVSLESFIFACRSVRVGNRSVVIILPRTTNWLKSLSGKYPSRSGYHQEKKHERSKNHPAFMV